MSIIGNLEIEQDYVRATPVTYGRTGPIWQAALAILGQWRRRIAERHELSRLDERELRDFGASRSDAITEARKPFWRG